ncbi:hypothetical protein IB268_26325 [Achromobacter sp. ACM01]|uniref:hypothetical protein n=1 Tax=Achromobacter sp. ACM01 TaxID=2769298 RepID=UPI0017862F06|nr:hypothetical protein [Achromobacter sp. ACM01]MBD9476455.1 hypothetical protein [Achromobacter sp. ACM01]
MTDHTPAAQAANPDFVGTELRGIIDVAGDSPTVIVSVERMRLWLSKLRAPVASAEVMDALNWVDDFIARCNRDDRGSCESVNVLRAALASAPVAGEAQPVAYRAWFDQDSGARWLFTLWPEEERLDVQWEPLFAAPQASEAVPTLPRGWQLALNLAIDAIENAAPAGQDWPVNWPAILHGLVELRAALSAQPGAQKESRDAE